MVNTFPIKHRVRKTIKNICFLSKRVAERDASALECSSDYRLVGNPGPGYIFRNRLPLNSFLTHVPSLERPATTVQQPAWHIVQAQAPARQQPLPSTRPGCGHHYVCLRACYTRGGRRHLSTCGVAILPLGGSGF